MLPVRGMFTLSTQIWENGINIFAKCPIGIIQCQEVILYSVFCLVRLIIS